MAEVPIDCEFPVWGLLPKKETGVVSFLTKNPEYDGRNTIIAILDSGVDPAADGLKLTSTGETKVIERFDCSGCGDVDTSTVIRKVVDGCITGVTGRKLKIPESWKNPSGEWRVGVLYPYQLYPTKVMERMQEHRKEHLWNVGHKPAFAECNKRLQEFENEIAGKGATLTLEDKQTKEELEARLEVLQAADKKFTDYGPTYDCVLFHDGSVWRACIDTSESGDLSTGPFLGEYSLTHEHSHLTPLDEMTVSINIHDEGNTLEVVGMCSTHGTHVAAISAGYFPEEPDRNGVAPGAKIVSLTIGDSRLGSMETGTALVRACIKVMELCKTMKIDVINMSYGEHAHWSHTGRIGEIMCTVVSRYGVNWVVSGGNHGPALCTVGAPPDIVKPYLIGVAAYVSPEMSSAAYSLRASVGAGAFSWSSRGPAASGALALSVCAPGAALTAVARFTLRNSQLMNGTSMAAPHVAGAVALLVCGLRARGLAWSPFSLKRALENSAAGLPHVEPWAQGCGLLQVEKAFEILSTYHDAPERDVSFSIQCGSNNNKGILLRPKIDDAPKDIPITIEPAFMHDHNDEEDKAVISKQISFGIRLALTCDAAWVSIPRHLDMMNAARPIAVRVDTTGLPPGPHFTSINAYDVKCIEKGPVFRVAVTVLQPEPLPSIPILRYNNVLFKPSTIKRHIIIPPAEASWAVLRLHTSCARAGRFLAHAMQLRPRLSCRAHETQKMMALTHEAPAALPFPVLGGVHLEVVVAKYWANLGDMALDYSVEFHGLRPDCGRVVLGGAESVARVELRALRGQDAAPNASLKYTEPVLRPSESKIASLGPRDVVPAARQVYELVNTYTFHIAKTTDVSPIVSGLSDMLYESEFESQLWMLYNTHKQLLAVGDAYPSKYTVKLDKGEYVLRLQVRHDNKSYLERLSDLPVIMQQRLPQPIALDVYGCKTAALTGGKKFNTTSLSSGTVLPLYITGVPNDKLSRSSLTIGHTLTGSITFAKDELGRRVDAYPVTYLVPEPARRNNRDARDSKEKSKPNEEYGDAYKDFLTTWLTKLEGDKLQSVYEEAGEKFPTALGLHLSYLQAIDNHTDHNKLPHVNVEPDVTTAWCEQLISIADKVIKQIDQEKLLAYLGMKNDPRSDATKIKAEQDKQRVLLVEALSRRGAALCRLLLLARADCDKLRRGLHDNHHALLQLADLADPKAIHYGIWYYFTLKQWGRAIKLLNKLSEERASKEIDERLIELYTELNWKHLADFTRKMIPIKYPSAYRPF